MLEAESISNRVLVNNILIIDRNFPSLPGRTGMGPVASGPCRLLPGGLAVSRAFGDIEAKVPKLGGNSNVLIAKPEITTLKINKAIDFIVLGSKILYDSSPNKSKVTVSMMSCPMLKLLNVFGTPSPERRPPTFTN